MAASMRDSAVDGGHRAKVADPRTAAATNFEYDDNEWDIGIGDLIIDLDADIEKTNEKAGGPAGGQMAQAAGKTKMAVEHSATVQDKGLKMKIKRTKPGTKTSEAKHEIVKPGEQNGAESGSEKAKNNQSAAVTKRLSGGHRKDKAREKHSGEKTPTQKTPSVAALSETSMNSAGVNGVARGGTVAAGSTGAAAPQTAQQPRPVFPASHGPGPPTPGSAVPSTPGPPVPAPTPKLEPPRLTAATPGPGAASGSEERSISVSPPPPKRIKTATSDSKELVDVCVGTSVGTITEPDCLGPCEPGTSVTLEGIVWHETEGGVLVVNVTWRGKTYVGTLLDCTRHDWAPPRFCDSPTSDLDARTPKGRGKRGRTSSSTNSSGDLSNFTETRSSVHSKLRNGSAKGGRGGRGNTPASSSSGTNSTGSNSPTPFVPPKQEIGKKSKERDTTPTPTNKKNKTPLSAPSSPPASPVLLECPEPNCSKKYKHINGLKYHQSHAHGSADDDDTKDVTSFSENEESNTEAPSPSATPVKSPPEKTETPRKEELSQSAPVLSPSVNPCCQVLQDPLALVKPSNPESPTPSQSVSLAPGPLTPQPSDLPAISTSPNGESGSDGSKAAAKPGVLRFVSPNEEFSVGVFSGNKSMVSSSVIPVAGSAGSNTSSVVSTLRTSTATAAPGVGQVPLGAPITVPNPQVHSNTSTSSHMQPPIQGITQNQSAHPQQQSQPLTQGSVPQQLPIKLPQFKLKPTASLMPEDKNKEKEKGSKLPPGYKKKHRKSPAGSPHPPSDPTFGMDSSSREDLQSPAYSDISDDAAPVLESEVGDKGKGTGEKKGEPNGAGSPHGIPTYGIYGSFYGQPPYLVPSVAPDCKPKETSEKSDVKPGEKELKKESGRGEYSQKVIPHPSHYYPYGYVPSYPSGFMDPNYPVIVPEDKNKESGKGDKSPGPAEIKLGASPIQVPNPTKVKAEPGLKEGKHQNENHQIIKESIEMKTQMNSYMYSRQPPTTQTQDDLKRYLYQRGREQTGQVGPEQQKQSSSATPKLPPPNPSPKLKEKVQEEKKDEKVKQEGQKPTMETQGPPPPPTSQYYIHPSYMQGPHYGALPFDPNHPVYRNINPMLVPGPYAANPYLGIPRYHAPEDLSRSPSGTTKALDLLQHHANQYYSSHKIHELQERALKSPTPTKSAPSRESPSGIPPSRPPSGPSQAPPTSTSSTMSGPSPPVKSLAAEGKDSRSPPPQRHVHTHHHTHVGLTYPILTGQYPAPYGAAVLASQQAAAVAASVMNPYPPK
ncbi:hypothetical protein RUM44_005510 [Polyplax serrata]|uniref:C2H2-type domain-containing protein n=1 Tax=Polyplax serrata TaxID=468196 RepID=A0ABR1ADL1_POLSC